MSLAIVLGPLLIALTLLAAKWLTVFDSGSVTAWQSEGEFLGTEGVVLQSKRNDCGPSALLMAFEHFGIRSSVAEIEQQLPMTNRGSSMLALKEMAELKGLRAEGWRFTLEDFLCHFTESRTTGKAPMPMILFIHGDHFAVVDSVRGDQVIYLRDPARGRFRFHANKLPRIWNGETLVLRMENAEIGLRDKKSFRTEYSPIRK